MKIVAIQDLHHNIDWVNPWFAAHTTPEDVKVFLGDWFDNWDDTPEIAEKTALWLRDSLKTPNTVFIIGNHEQSYRWWQYRCTGWTQEKHKVINSILTKDDWAKMKLYYKHDNWYFSHAGLHPKLFCNLDGFVGDKKLQEMCDQAVAYANLGKTSLILNAGYSRGGKQEVGGITWLDWREFFPIPGINQVVGHTHDSNIGEFNVKDSKNYCIDRYGHNTVLILENNEVEVLRADAV
jgi:hypothetical protein